MSLLNTKQRKSIVREAKRMIREKEKDFENLQSGEKEAILDRYVEIVCKTKGWELSDFYFEESKKLEKILQ
jgi:hypothetical protein